MLSFDYVKVLVKASTWGFSLVRYAVDVTPQPINDQESYTLFDNLRREGWYSVKRGDVTRWKQGYITRPPPYFILWSTVTSLGESKVI